MADATWKAVERRIAELLGTTREGPTGECDAETDRLSLEIKHRTVVSGYLLDWLKQAEEHCRGERVPVVVIHKKHQPYEDSICMLKLSHLLALLEGSE